MRALRPSIDTKFHIDFSWWEKQNKDIRVFMRELLCPESSEAAAAAPDKQLVDMVDPQTAEVTQVDALWEAIRACCSFKPDYIAPDTPILDGIFRVFLANGNTPLTPVELYQVFNRRPLGVILRALTG